MEATYVYINKWMDTEEMEELNWNMFLQKCLSQPNKSIFAIVAKMTIIFADLSMVQGEHPSLPDHVWRLCYLIALTQWDFSLHHNTLSSLRHTYRILLVDLVIFKVFCISFLDYP